MIKLLLRNRINYIIGTMLGKGRGKEIKKASLGKKIAVAVTAALVLLIALAYVVGFEIMLAEAVLPSLPWLYYGIFTIVSFSLTFFLSIFETKSELFECRDNELLISMPIKPGDILASRMIIVLLYNYLSDLLFMVPAVIIYGIYTGDIVGIIGGTIVTLMLPLLSSSLSSGVGYIVARLSKKFKNKTIMSIIFFLVFFGAYMFFIDFAMEGLAEFIEDLIMSLDASAGMDTFLYQIGSLSLIRPLPFAIFLVGTLLLSFLAFWIISASYEKVLSTSDKAKTYRYVKKTLVSSSAFTSLLKKEFKRLTTSSTYLINAAIGLVLPIFVIGSVFVSFLTSGEDIATLEGVFHALSPFIPIAAAGIAALGAMTYLSACALSLEGRAFWHIKSMPISSRAVLLSKTMPQIVLSIPFNLITAIAVSIAFKLSFAYSIFVVLIPLVANVLFAFFGTFMNATFPRFDYENEAHIVKRSMSAGLTMLFQMLLTIGIGVGTYFVIDATNYSERVTIYILIGLLAVYVILALLAIFAVLFVSARKLDKMNV